MGRVEEREAEAALDRLERPLGPRALEADRAAVDPLRVQIAEDQVGVAHGRLGAAEPVARGSGDGAGAARPDLQGAGRVDPGDRAAAGADRLDGHRGQPDRIVAELPLARRLRYAVGDEADVRGGAAHVKGERPRQLERAGQMRGRRHARGGARHGHCQWARPGGIDRHHAAGRVKEMNRNRAGLRREARHQVVDVTRGQRHHRRVEHRRARALVFPELGVDLARNRHVGEMRGDRSPQRLLVRRVCIRVEETDRHALDALAPEPLDDGGHFAEIERRQHRAVGPDALAHLGAKPARHEGLGLGRQIDPVEMRTVHTADLEHVAEAPRGDEADSVDLALDDRVGDERGPVGERGAAAGRAADGGQAVEQTSGRIGGGRRHLEGARPARGVAGDEIGEGAAHVDTDTNARDCHEIRNRARISSGRSE